MLKIRKIFKDIEKTQAILLTCVFVDTILQSLAYPMIRKTTGELLPSRYFAIEGIVCSVSIIIACALWNSKGFRKFSFKIYTTLAVIESIAWLSLGVTMYFHFNVWIFAIGSLLCVSVISVYIARIINSFRVALFPDRKREFYDNNVRLVDCISGLIGLGIAAIFPLSLDISVLLWGLGTVGTVGWLIVYGKNRKRLNSIEKNDDEPYIIEDIH